MSNLAEPENDGTNPESWDILDDFFEDRECPECEGTGYDADDTPCEWCFGDGVL